MPECHFTHTTEENEFEANIVEKKRAEVPW